MIFSLEWKSLSWDDFVVLPLWELPVISHNRRPEIWLKYFQLNCVVVPSKALADPGELDRALTASLTSTITEGFVATAAAGVAPNVVQVGNVDCEMYLLKWWWCQLLTIQHLTNTKLKFDSLMFSYEATGRFWEMKFLAWEGGGVVWIFWPSESFEPSLEASLNSQN